MAWRSSVSGVVIFSSRTVLVPIALAGLAIAGGVTRRIDDGSSRPESAAAASWGNWRPLIANVLWLQGYLAWERRDAEATERLVHWAVTVNPAAKTLRLNAARILAHDLAHWSLKNGYDANPERRIVRRQAQRAIMLLMSGLPPEMPAADIWLERGNIELHRLGDLAAAAESYRRAALEPDAPQVAARLHAEMLHRLGRNAEALAWLERILPTLPADDAAAARDVVVERIRRWRSELESRGGPDATLTPTALPPSMRSFRDD